MKKPAVKSNAQTRSRKSVAVQRTQKKNISVPHRERQEITTKSKQACPVAPAQVVDPNWDEVTQLQGEPFYSRILNQGFWAEFYRRKHRTAFVIEEHGFSEYDASSGLWKPITREAIRERLSTLILEESRRREIPQLAGLRCVSALNGIVDRLKGMCEEHQAVFDPRAPRIHVADGVILLDKPDPVFTAFSANHHSRHQLPVSYDPKAKCHRFLKELLGPAVSKEDVELLQLYAGAALYGRNLAQRLLILEGVAGSGKSTFVKIIQGIIGQCNCGELRTRHLTGRFETHRFLDKKLLVAPDVSADFLTACGAHMIKPLVGDDQFDAERKNSNRSYPMRGEFNLIITANERLRVKLQGDADAWRRRLLIVRFNTPPKVKVSNFAGLLIRGEGAGILNWALDGYVKLAKALAKTGDFPLAKAQLDRVATLLDESDSARAFLNERVVCDAKGNVATTELEDAYVRFCAERGWTALPARLVEHELARLMAEIHHVTRSHSIKRKGHGARRGYRGVRLK